MSNGASLQQTIADLRGLSQIRRRAEIVTKLIKEGKSKYWTYHEDKLPDVVKYCAGLITRDFGTDYSKIPPHCRRNHFVTEGRDRIALLQSAPGFPESKLEQTRALIDLYMVSVLLDAGAGKVWEYTERDEDGKEIWKGGRSEGLAMASLQMFKDGLFSSKPDSKFQVDASALKNLSVKQMAKDFQVSAENHMDGLEGRCQLLMKLGEQLAKNDMKRPSDILDKLNKTEGANGETVVSLEDIWSVASDLLAPIWPSRTQLPSHPDIPLGDVWACKLLSEHLDASGVTRTEGDHFAVFQKLQQWMCYSLLEPLRSVARWTVTGDSQTGLPEYRNGGLFMDHGVFKLNTSALDEATDFPNGTDNPPCLDPGHQAVVQWRALTVNSLDLVHAGVCKELNADLSLAQVLEAATWKGGREMAKKLRGGASPLDIKSDGTVF